MENKMKEYLPKIEMEKMKALLEVEEKYGNGQLSLDDARKEIAEKVGVVKPYHIAYAEQNLKEESEDECMRENITKLLELLDGFMDTSRPDLPDDHPIMHYYKENDEMKQLLKSVEDLVQYPVIKNQWLELYDRIRQYPIHYARKQNQLYPLLEKKGFNRPTTTMWNFDDMIRDQIKESIVLLEKNDEESFIKLQKELVEYARDLIQKEERILYPTSLALISPAEFEDMKSGDQEIGFAFFDVEHKTNEPKTNAAPDGFADELRELLSKYGYGAGPQQELDVTTGKLTLEQINLIFQHLPVDISYVDENELVKFYSDTNHRIFPRSKNVIGREVTNCHPRKSVHIVQEIVEKFRNGEQDKAEFWINKPGLFIYIIYIAVRDKKGRFRGILEMMQECNHIRSFEGSQTLLAWAGKNEQENTEVKSESDESDTPLTITPETRLKDIFSKHPEAKKALVEKYPKLKMLNSPLGKIMLQRATIKMASQNSGISQEELTKTILNAIGS